MPTSDLREALGLDTLGGAIKTPEQKEQERQNATTGAAALQRDLQKAFDEGRGSNALKPEPEPTPQPQQSPSTPAYSVPWSTTPVHMPEQGSEVPNPIRVSAHQVESTAPVRTQPSVMPVEGTSGYTGTTSSPSTDQLAWQDDWEKQRAQDEGREVRTTNYFGEEYDMDGAGNLPTLFDNQLGAVGNTPTNDAYLRNAIASGMLSEEDARTIYDRMSGGKSYWQQLVDKWSPFKGEYDYDVNRDSTGNMGVIDDGTSYDYAHMTSDMMSGQQYRQYVMMGMGGRPYDEIDPEKQYSKRREALEYDFIPFTPDDTSLAHMATSNLISVPGRIGSNIANLREELTDYGIDVNGRHVSGDEFDRKSGALVHQFERESQTNPEKFLHDHEESGTPIVREFVIPDVNGRNTYHYGVMKSATAYPDGTYRIEFSDGSGVNVSEDYLMSKTEDGTFSLESNPVLATNARGMLPPDLESLNDMSYIKQRVAEDGGTMLDYAPVLYLPEMVMDNGVHLNYNEVRGIYYDQTPKDDEGEDDDGISYDFMTNIPGTPIPLPVNNKPSKFSEELFTLENGVGPQMFNLSDLGNNLVDWTLGSIPISLGGDLMSGNPLGYIPLAYSLSNAATSLSGVDPGTYDPETGSYGLIAGDYDDNGNFRYGVKNTDLKFDRNLGNETIASNVLGNMVVPLTEHLAGNIGSDPFKNTLYKFGLEKLPELPTVKQLVTDTLVDNLGEGLEEIIGNFVDELTQYGPSGFGASQVYDRYGEPMYDRSGHELRNYNTPIGQRLTNMFMPAGSPTKSVDNSVNALLGGMGVSAMMNLLSNPFGPDWFPKQFAKAAQRDIARWTNGAPQYVAPEIDADYVKAPEEFLDTFSNERPQHVI